MSEFKIKKGMVFYLERPADNQPIRCISSYAPEKKRPYMVISNDRCNEHSALIHVAPIFTRDYNPDRYYQVPFKSISDRDCVVDIASIMLVPRELLTISSYSDAITKYTIANTTLIEGIGKAIMRQFDIKEQIPQTVEYTPREQTITLNININGTRIVPNVNTSTNEIDINFDAIECNDSKETHTSTNRNTTPFRILHLNKYVETSESDKEYMRQILKENYRKFDGTMSLSDIAHCIGVSVSTLSRILSKMKDSYVKKNEKASEVSHDVDSKVLFRPRFTMTPQEEEELVQDYRIHTASWCLNKYKHCGFTSSIQIYGKVRNIQNKRKKMFEGTK